MHCTERQTLNLSVMPFGNTFHGKNTYAHIFTCLPSSPSNYLIAEGWTRCYAHIVLKTGRCILLHKHMKTSMTNQIHGQSKSGTAFRTQWKTCQCLRNACTVAKWIQSTAAQSMLWSNEFIYMYTCIDDLKHLLYNCSCRFRNSLDDPCEGLTSLNCYNCPPLPTRDY